MLTKWLAFAALALLLCSCNKPVTNSSPVSQSTGLETVGVVAVAPRTLRTSLTLSSELVPFQQIDVYAKESGYVKQLLVDYGTRVRSGQLMAVLEIPELQALIEQDRALIAAATDQISRAKHDVATAEAQHKVSSLIYSRLANVQKVKPGLVAQQEVDDAQGKDLATQGQLAAAQSALDGATSQLGVAKAKLAHDEVLYSYSRITAPFDGVVTKRYGNLGTLLQAGTNSSTQAMPVVQLSQDSLFRLVIPVPETSVRYVKVGDPVQVRVPALARDFEGRVARISVDVAQSTRTMHTEVDVSNQGRVLMPGLYAEAVLDLESNASALAVPVQAIDRDGARTSVMVVGANGKIEERDVSLGIETAAYREILHGVREGERVVITDRGALKPGDVVKPVTRELLSYR